MLDTHREFELVDQVATAPRNERLQVLVDNAPRVLRVSWAMVITRASGGVLQLFGSSGAPETPLTRADWLPLERAAQLDAEGDWVPDAWKEMDTRLAAAPVGSNEKAVLLGRIGGPDPPSVGGCPARLRTAGIVSTVLRADA